MLHVHASLDIGCLSASPFGCEKDMIFDRMTVWNARLL